jgi:phospholipid-transporting ATPase
VLNYILVGNLLLALICAAVNVIFFVAWTGENQDTASYIFQLSEETPNMWLKNLFSVYLIVNSFVPLDLLVALELSKLFYTSYMENDAQMTIADFVARDTVGFQAHTLSLHEELALVEYIFCDKTGTLTQNELVFRALSLQRGQKIFFTDEDKEGLNI